MSQVLSMEALEDSVLNLTHARSSNRCEESNIKSILNFFSPGAAVMRRKPKCLFLPKSEADNMRWAQLNALEEHWQIFGFFETIFLNFLKILTILKREAAAHLITLPLSPPPPPSTPYPGNSFQRSAFFQESKYIIYILLHTHYPGNSFQRSAFFQAFKNISFKQLNIFLPSI